VVVEIRLSAHQLAGSAQEDDKKARLVWALQEHIMEPTFALAAPSNGG